jgi:Ca2+-binding EF-hand superfamily protein
VFKIFDRDESGFIDPDELGVGLRAIGCNPTEAEIKQMIQDAGEKRL